MADCAVPDTYTEAELTHCTLCCLLKFSGMQQVYVGLCNAAMLLFSTTTAVHGGSPHILHWSDLFMLEIPMDDVCVGKKVQVSYVTTIKLIPNLNQLFFRSWPLSRIMPNTISRAMLMSTAHLDIR